MCFVIHNYFPILNMATEFGYRSRGHRGIMGLNIAISTCVADLAGLFLFSILQFFNSSILRYESTHHPIHLDFLSLWSLYSAKSGIFL